LDYGRLLASPAKAESILPTLPEKQRRQTEDPSYEPAPKRKYERVNASKKRLNASKIANIY
jgi:hypothetical protein